MKFFIRELREEDLLDGRGFFSTLDNLKESKRPTPLQKRYLFQNISQNSYVFVAVSQGRKCRGEIIGTIKLIIEFKFYHGDRPAGHIEDVATRKGFEGQGIARDLIKHAIQGAKKHLCYKVILDCDQDLIPFYEKSGFYEFQVCMRRDLD